MMDLCEVRYLIRKKDTILTLSSLFVDILKEKISKEMKEPNLHED